MGVPVAAEGGGLALNARPEPLGSGCQGEQLHSAATGASYTQVVGELRRFAVKAVGVSALPDYPRVFLALEYRRRSPHPPGLEIRPEPDNPVDKNALLITSINAGRRLGYLPRMVAARLWPLIMEQGQCWAVSDYKILVEPGLPERPGLEVVLERIEWAPEPPGPEPVPMGSEPVHIARPQRRRDVLRHVTRQVSAAIESQPKVVPTGVDRYAVQSSSGDYWHEVLVDPTDLGQPLYCSCAAGVFYGRMPVPCRHAAAVGLAAGVLDASDRRFQLAS